MNYKLVMSGANGTNETKDMFSTWAAAMVALKIAGPGHFVQGPTRAWWGEGTTIQDFRTAKDALKSVYDRNWQSWGMHHRGTREELDAVVAYAAAFAELPETVRAYERDHFWEAAR